MEEVECANPWKEIKTHPNNKFPFQCPSNNCLHGSRLLFTAKRADNFSMEKKNQYSQVCKVIKLEEQIFCLYSQHIIKGVSRPPKHWFKDHLNSCKKKLVTDSRGGRIFPLQKCEIWHLFLSNQSNETAMDSNSQVGLSFWDGGWMWCEGQTDWNPKSPYLRISHISLVDT